MKPSASKLSRRLFNSKRELERVMLLPANLKVAVSRLPNAGLGVFAIEDIASKTLLGTYTGKKCGSEDGDYVLDVSGYDEDGKHVTKCVDAEELPGGPNKTNWTRFINGVSYIGGVRVTTQVKNVEFFIKGFGKSVSIGVRTTRDIKKGDELLLDYGPEYF